MNNTGSHKISSDKFTEQVDASFKVILEQLATIEEIVENNLDNESFPVREKVHEKIALRVNKVKVILANIAYK